MTVIDDKNDSLFFDHEYEFNELLFVVIVIEFELIERSMSSSSLKEVYNFEHEIQKVHNDFSKQHDYSFIKEDRDEITKRARK